MNEAQSCGQWSCERYGGGGKDKLGGSVKPTSFTAMIMPAASVAIDRNSPRDKETRLPAELSIIGVNTAVDTKMTDAIGTTYDTVFEISPTDSTSSAVTTVST